jgi:glycosyltransferase involved in cell wall biosynthesis
VPPDLVNASCSDLTVSLVPGRRPTSVGESWTIEQLSGLIRSGRILGHIQRYGSVEGRIADIGAFPRPFAITACLRLLARGRCELRADGGEIRAVTVGSVLRRGLGAVADMIVRPRIRARIAGMLAELEAHNVANPPKAIVARAPALLVRSDLWLGITTGGAVAHTAGIANALAQCQSEPVLAAYERNPILAETVAFEALPVPERFWDFKELPLLAANLGLVGDVERIIATRGTAFVYHRSSLLSFGAALAARRRGLPLIVEYNGSEAWIARNWGKPLTNETLALRIEDAVLKAATTIVAVSEGLRRELRARTILDDSRIVVVPNGVDCARFRGDLDGMPMRRRLGIGAGEIVIGFIGSFSVWHGVGALVDAFATLDRRASDGSARLRLLLIGDGPLFASIAASVRQLGLGDRVILAGKVDQADAPAYLAAADILCAPHVENADGSEFFGSPTKLFEYMAMGRAIVASRLGQIGEILEDDRTALLVPPGDVSALAAALDRLASDATLRARLSSAARADAVRFHGWESRVSAILAAGARSANSGDLA